MSLRRRPKAAFSPSPVMLVGIGFLTLLIGAASERFVARDLAEDADEMERGLDETAAAVLRDVRGRLDALEAAVRQAGGTSATR